MSECVVSHGFNKKGEPRHQQAQRGLLCKNHSQRLGEWLRDIAVDYTLLETVLMPSQSHAERRSKGDDAAAPINLSVVALRDTERGGPPRERGDELWYELPDIPSVVATLHARAEDIRCLLDPARVYDDSVKDRYVVTEVTYLIDVFDTLCAVDWIDEAFDDVKRAWIALQRAHDRPRPRPIGRCLNIDCDGTVWPRPETAPWCSKCKRIYDNDAEVIKVGIEEEKRRKRAKAGAA